MTLDKCKSVFNPLFVHFRYKKWSTHSKFREVRDIARSKEIEAENQSIFSDRMFGEKETKPRRCVSWGCTCCSEKAKCQATCLRNTLRRRCKKKTKRTKLSNTCTLCAAHTLLLFILNEKKNIWIKMHGHFTNKLLQEKSSHMLISIPSPYETNEKKQH